MYLELTMAEKNMIKTLSSLFDKGIMRQYIHADQEPQLESLLMDFHLSSITGFFENEEEKDKLYELYHFFYD